MKEARQKSIRRVIPFLDNAGKYKLICSDREQVRACLVMKAAKRWEEAGGTLRKGVREIWGVMGTFPLWMRVMTKAYTYVKT